MADFLDDVSDKLWGFVAGCSSDDETARVVNGKSQEELVGLFQEFVQLRADIAEELTSSGLVLDASEDTLDDLAEALVLEGKSAVAEMLAARRPLPPRAHWGDLRGIAHIVSNSYNRRFGGEIFDELED